MAITQAVVTATRCITAGCGCARFRAVFKRPPLSKGADLAVSANPPCMKKKMATSQEYRVPGLEVGHGAGKCTQLWLLVCEKLCNCIFLWDHFGLCLQGGEIHRKIKNDINNWLGRARSRSLLALYEYVLFWVFLEIRIIQINHDAEF